jgi:hypothetical protein
VRFFVLTSVIYELTACGFSDLFFLSDWEVAAEPSAEPKPTSISLGDFRSSALQVRTSPLVATVEAK